MNTLLDIRNVLLVVLLGLLGLAWTAPANAAPALDGTFELSGEPGQMTLGPDGNVWFTLLSSSDGKEFGRIEPDGTVTEYETPNGQPVTGITAGPNLQDGNRERIWMTQTQSVVKWDPVAETGSAIPVPDLNGPRVIIADDEGFLWAVDDSGALVRISAAGVSFEFPVAGSTGRGITRSGDNLFWADFGQQQIHRSPLATPGSPTSFDVGGGPQEVAAGPDGQVAYTNPGDFPQTVGLINPNGNVGEFEVPNTDPFGLTFADDGAYWVANFASGDLTRLTTSGGLSTPIEFPDGSGPRYIAKGTGGTLWVGLETAQKIARVTGVKTEGGNGPGPGPGPGPTRLKLSGVKVTKGKRLRVLATLNKAATVTIALDRRKKGRKFRKLRTVTRKGAAGRNVFTLARPSRKGAYRVRVVARGGDEKSGPVIRKFRIR